MVDGKSFFFLLLSLSICDFFVHSAKLETAYVIKNNDGTFQVQENVMSRDWVAQAEFVNAINATGWSYLTVTTNGQHTNKDQAYAAGMIEGYKTKELIHQHWLNTIQGQFCEPPLDPQCRELRDFLQTNIHWMQNQIQNSPQDDYWRMVELFLVQVDGLSDGYFNHPSDISTDIDPMGLLLLSLSGDMEDLTVALDPKHKSSRPVGSGSCSALIKLLPGNKDLFVAHDTWDTYQSMLRILKKYDFAYQTVNQESVPGKVITMSSYPGVLLSGDDYYLISSGLASLETTIGNNNADLYQYIKPQTVMEGIRTMAANRLAKTGQEWSTQFLKYQSGTYNNQWMVVDYKRFMPGFAPGAGTLTILEQIPGHFDFADKTDLLTKQSYWPSYNIAYFPSIFNMSGCWDNVKKYGDWFTYDKAPRAQIFKRDQDKVVDLLSMQKLMRYNDFPHDPLARCNCTPPYSGENGISARCDLNPANGTYPFPTLGHRSHGGTDMKLTNSAMFKEQEFIAISGPTYDQLPPFQWSKADFASAAPHHGHPDIFKFDPVHFNGTFQVDKSGEARIKIIVQ